MNNSNNFNRNKIILLITMIFAMFVTTSCGKHINTDYIISKAEKKIEKKIEKKVEKKLTEKIDGLDEKIENELGNLDSKVNKKVIDFAIKHGGSYSVNGKDIVVDGKLIEENLPNTDTSIDNSKLTIKDFDYNSIPPFDGQTPRYTLNNGNPYFLSEPDFSLDAKAYEHYSNLDSLGRVGVADAVLTQELMPTEKRKSIYKIKPSGWQSIKYDNIPAGSLYNRCHLIGFQLAGENANEKNLMTGTRFLNIDGMVDFEDIVREHIELFEGRVRYRVTPIFVGDELVARGIIMEGYSLDDNGQSIKFNNFVYNNQPGIEINYKDGTSKAI